MWQILLSSWPGEARYGKGLAASEVYALDEARDGKTDWKDTHLNITHDHRHMWTANCHSWLWYLQSTCKGLYVKHHTPEPGQLMFVHAKGITTITFTGSTEMGKRYDTQ